MAVDGRCPIPGIIPAPESEVGHSLNRDMKTGVSDNRRDDPGQRFRGPAIVSTHHRSHCLPSVKPKPYLGALSYLWEE